MENEKVCGTCGCFPCMGICPLNDPYAGNQEAEEADYSFGARYDRFDGYDRGDLDYREEPEAKVNVGGIAMTVSEFTSYINRPLPPLPPTPTDPNDPDFIPF